MYTNNIMEDFNDDYKVLDDSNGHDCEFEYNFINTPWDDRSSKSKVGIMALLVTIFVATLACVVQNLIVHYSNMSNQKGSTPEMKCNLVKMQKYGYAARIHSAKTNGLLCLGAVVSETSVLAIGVCVKSGPVLIHIGSFTDPRCKTGFAVDSIQPLVHHGAGLSKLLVLLTTSKSVAYCGRIIPIGKNLHGKSGVHVIGRPLSSGRLLSRTPAKLLGAERSNQNGFNTTICVSDLGMCPVRVGDLLIQQSRLFGIASTSAHLTKHNRLACFADLRALRDDINYRKHVGMTKFLWPNSV